MLLACSTQAQASELAHKFNRRLGVSASGRDLQVHFLPCFVYTVIDNNFKYPGGKAKVLVEPLLEGKFQVPPSSPCHGYRVQPTSLTLTLTLTRMQPGILTLALALTPTRVERQAEMEQQRRCSVESPVDAAGQSGGGGAH